MKKVIALIFILLFCNLTFSEGEKEILSTASQAIISAETWIVSLDKGEYDICFESASDFLKNSVQKDVFIQNLNDVLKPFGKMISRELISITFAKQLPNAPDGEYIVLQYKIIFENNKEGIETITPMLEKDGTWKISGYYIK